jgi:hypothetical protein
MAAMVLQEVIVAHAAAQTFAAVVMLTVTN